MKIFNTITRYILPLFVSTISFAQDGWFPSEKSGFGIMGNEMVKCMQPFKGYLYAGVGDNTGSILRSSTGNLNSWSTVFDGSLYTYITNITAMNVTADGGGYIYMAADGNSSDGPKVFMSADGSVGSWTPYFASGYAVSYILPFKGTGATDSICLFENNYNGTIIHRSSYNNNDPYNANSSWLTVFDMSQYIPNATATSAYSTGTKMYMGTNYGGTLWSSTNGFNWVQNTNVGNGFGNSNNNAITAITSFGGYIYAGTDNSSDGAQIWRSSDEITWTLVKQYSNNYNRVTSLTAAGGKLWVTLFSSTNSLSMVERSADGQTYVTSNKDGFGDTHNYGKEGNTAVFNNKLFVGLRTYAMPQMPTGKNSNKVSAFGVSLGQIWETCLGTPPTVNLGPDQTVCSNVPVILNAGSGFATYYWDSGDSTKTDTITTPGNHSVVVSNAAGCFASDTVKIIHKASPGISFVYPEGPITVCKNDTLNIHTMVESNIRLAPKPPMIRKVNDTIMDYQTTADTINVTGINNDDGAAYTLVSVTIDSLYHADDGQLTITLYAPDGSSVILAQGVGYSTANFIGTVFNTTATASPSSSNGPFTGQFKPQKPFTNFGGLTNGKWHLDIYDNYSGTQGSLKGWSLQFSEKDTNITYSWTPSTYLNVTNKAMVRSIPAASVVYTLTATSANGCVSKDSAIVTVPKMTVANSSVVSCYGSTVQVTAKGGSTYYWTPATGLNTALGDTVIASPTVTTKYYVRDTIATCAIVDSVTVKANPQLTASAGAAQTICFADTATFTANATGGTSPYTYHWSVGNTTQVLKVSPSVGCLYIITITDNSGCKATNTTSVTITPSTDVYGRVDTSGVPITKGNVVIYKYLPYKTHFDTIQVQPLDASGHYHFTNINHGDYLIEVFADTIQYPNGIPTYYGNQSLWNVLPSEIAHHNCTATDTFNITLIDVHPVPAGNGRLSGNISKGPGFGKSPTAPGNTFGERTDPIPGVDVKLGKNPGGSSNIVGETQTDGNGNYHFGSLSLNNTYVIYVDIPGLGRDSSYVVTPVLTDSVILNLDYIADSTLIRIVPKQTTTAVKNLNAPAIDQLSVYPNPSNGNATIEYNVKSDATVSLGIYNILGVKVVDVVNSEQHSGSYKYNINTRKNNLSPGAYFIRLAMDGKTSTQKIIITE